MKLIVSFTIISFAIGITHSTAGPVVLGPRGGGRIVHEPLSRYDTDHNGVVTAAEFASAGAAEVQELQTKLFEKLDGNSDGDITSDEARAIFEAASERWLAGILARFDRNHDGAITAADFPWGRLPLAHLSLGQYDADHDGALSSGELMAAAAALAADQQEKFLARFDTDGDGTVTTAEALAVHQAIVAGRIESLLKKFDLNGDGDVTSAEVITVLRSRDIHPGGFHR